MRKKYHTATERQLRNRELARESAARYPERRREAKRRFNGIKDATDERRVGPCEICGTHADPLCLDHNHVTGLSRGWICQLCNMGLARFRDNPEFLRRAAEYLVSHIRA